MLYYLFEYLESHYNLPGASLFQYISFRSAMAFIISLLFSTIYGKRIINYLRFKQVGESVRDLGLVGQAEKAGTPTMGCIIIILATLIPVLLFAQVDNVYIVILLVSTTIADDPAAKPSIPSVKFAPFDTAVIMKITIGIKINHAYFLAASPNKSNAAA